MKIKVKGLVFVGFAAAVFAQSALAADTAQDLADKKTVASKYYVDHTFQTLENITTTAEITDNGTNTEAVAAHWNSEAEYPSMAVLKSVKDSVASIHGDTDYIEVSEDANGKKVGIITNNLGTTADIYGNSNTGRLVTVGAVNGLLDTQISGTEYDSTVPTSLAVQTYAEATANKLAETSLGTTTITPENATGNDGNTTFPTTRNVYDFVNGAIGTAGQAYQRKLDSGETALYIGKYDSGDSTWKALEAVSSDSSDAQTDRNYVTIRESSGVYSIDIPRNRLAAAYTDLTADTSTSDYKLVTVGDVRQTILKAGSTSGGTIAATAEATNNNISENTVPTVKNVYEFVTNYAAGNYQPKILDSDAGKVMIGYNTATTSGNETTYSSNWRQLTVDSTYMTLDTTTGAAITLANVGHAGTDISGAAAASAQSGTDKIASAYAVQEYVQSLLHGNVLPAAGSDCQEGENGITSSNGKACALVLAYHDNAVGLKWIPMAQ